MSDIIFKQLTMLSDPMRIRILRVLSTDSCTVGELVVIFECPQSTVSRHLKMLSSQGWLTRRAVGASSWYAFNVADLPAPQRQLWSIVSSEFQEDYSRDLSRLHSTIAMRHTDSAEFFQRIGQKWSELRADLFGDAFLLQAIGQLMPPGLIVADLGCGTGDALAALAPSVKSVIGVDRSAEMLNLCRNKMSHLENVDFRKGSIESLPIESEEIDAAFCLLVLHHIDDLDRAFSEISRVLKEGGRLILVDMLPHGRAEFQRKMGHRQLGFSKEHIGDLARASGLSMRSWYSLNRPDGALGPTLFLSVLHKEIDEYVKSTLSTSTLEPQ